MSVFELYLLTRLDSISTISLVFLFLLPAIFMFATLASYLGIDNAYDEDRELSIYNMYIKTARVVGVLFSISLFTYIATPSKEDIAIIAGLNWATNSEEVTKMPENVSKVINKYLEELTEDEKND